MRVGSSNNSFSLSEWSGALGDMGTMLPLAFALAAFNGYPLERLFLLWGAAYIVTGILFRVPVAVQPLKAMAVIAITSGFAPRELSTAGVLFGTVMVLLVVTRSVALLERVFTRGVVRGIQGGVGAILIAKAVDLVLSNGYYVGTLREGWGPVSAVTVAVFLLVVSKRMFGAHSAFFLVAAAAAWGILAAPDRSAPGTGVLLAPSLPDTGFLLPALFVLVIPQLPLTLGNAVFASSDACRTYWPERAARISPQRFALSIGILDTAIGLLGGFPVCHGSGGVAAHRRFGARTGGATVIMGSLLVLSALLPGVAGAVLCVPVPLAGAMLALAGWELVALLWHTEGRAEKSCAVGVAVLSAATANLAYAMAAGIIMERTLAFVSARYKH